MKGVFWKEGEAFTNSMSLIVSLMVRYPEIATLSLNPEEKSIHFTFLIAHPLTEDEFNNFKERLFLGLQVMAEIHQRAMEVCTVAHQSQDNFGFMEISRDIASITQEEISLLVNLIREVFTGDLVSDQEDSIGEEEQVFQEEMIDHMLEDLKDSRQEKRLIGIREEGRVMVFNRADTR
jgi:hypothetical protein